LHIYRFFHKPINIPIIVRYGKKWKSKFVEIDAYLPLKYGKLDANSIFICGRRET